LILATLRIFLYSFIIPFRLQRKRTQRIVFQTDETRSSTTSKTETVTNWMKQTSEFIYSLDSNHIITLGTEGFTPIYNTGDAGPFLSDIGDIAPGALPTAHYYVQYEKQKTATVIKD
jgi:endo-1,4-beta-mannosidase